MNSLPLLLSATSSLWNPAEALFYPSAMKSKLIRRRYPFSLTFDTPTRSHLLTSSLLSPTSVFRDFFDDREMFSLSTDLRDHDLIPNSRMPLDIQETETSYKITAELPGIPKDDIKIEIQDGVLSISGEKKKHKEENDKNQKYRREEISIGIVSRSFTLPDNANENQVHASFENGILNITIDKVVDMPENKKVKTIEISDNK